jgi:hypothetical protein
MFKIISRNLENISSLVGEKRSSRFECLFQADKSSCIDKRSLAAFIRNLSQEFPNIFSNELTLINQAGSQKSTSLGLIFELRIKDGEDRERRIALYSEFISASRKEIFFKKIDPDTKSEQRGTDVIDSALTALSSDASQILSCRFVLSFFKSQGVPLFSDSSPTLTDSLSLEIAPLRVSFELFATAVKNGDFPLSNWDQSLERIDRAVQGLTKQSLLKSYRDS